MAKLNVKVIDMKGGEVTRIEYEGEAYKRVETGRYGIKAGDVVLNLHDGPDLTVGAYYEVVRRRDRTTIIDDVGDVHGAALRNCKVFRKEGATSSAEPSVKYREVKRPATVGDRIRIVNAVRTCGMYENGDEFIVTGDKWKDGDIYVSDVGTLEGNASGLIFKREYVVLEPVAEDEAPLKVGDYVKVVKEYRATNAAKGSIWVIKEDDKSSMPYSCEMVSERDPLTQWFNKDALVRATDEEVAKAKAELEESRKPKFNVGDYAKVTGRTFFKDIREGRYVKITVGQDADGDYAIELLDGSDNDCAQPSALEPVKAEDIPFIRAEREPGEFKRNDVVYIEQKDGTKRVGAVEDVTTSGAVGARVGRVAHERGARYIAYFPDEGDKITLITPVESRVDIPAGGDCS